MQRCNYSYKNQQFSSTPSRSYCGKNVLKLVECYAKNLTPKPHGTARRTVQSARRNFLTDVELLPAICYV